MYRCPNCNEETISWVSKLKQYLLFALPITCDNCKSNLTVGSSIASFGSYILALIVIGIISVLTDTKFYILLLVLGLPAQMVIHIVLAPLEIK